MVLSRQPTGPLVVDYILTPVDPERQRRGAVRLPPMRGLPVDAEALLELVRGHWGGEKGLHRTLDMQFREDDCRLRTGPPSWASCAGPP